MDTLNTEFVQLMNAAGWNQAETARRLGITSGAVNQFVKGTSRPSSTTLQCLRFVVLQERPEVMHYKIAPNGQIIGLRLREGHGTPEKEARQDWESRIIEMLAPLTEENREKVLSVIQSMVECLIPKKSP